MTPTAAEPACCFRDCSAIYGAAACESLLSVKEATSVDDGVISVMSKNLIIPKPMSFPVLREAHGSNSGVGHSWEGLNL